MKRVCSLVLAVILALGVTACGGEKAKDVFVVLRMDNDCKIMIE